MKKIVMRINNMKITQIIIMVIVIALGAWLLFGNKSVETEPAEETSISRDDAVTEEYSEMKDDEVINVGAGALPEEEGAVNNYIHAHLDELSTIKPVLGGSWHITELGVMMEKKSGRVRYEDGHILIEAKFDYFITSKGEITILNWDNAQLVDGK